MPHAVQVHRPGGPEQLIWDEVEVGDPGPGQVRLRQTAAGLNFIDVYHRSGQYEQSLPFIPGVEGAGVIEEIGPDVAGLKQGDRVAYAGPLGGYAEVRLIAADRLVKLSEDIGDEQAAAMMLKGMTVDMLIRSVRPLKPGDTILVHAAAGGIGLILCQWASALGATVIGTVSNEEKAELARAHGCHHPIVYTRQDFVAEVKRLTDGRKLPVVYDSVGRDTFLKSLDCLQKRGLMVSFGQSSGPVEPFAPRLLSQKGSLYLTRPTLFDYIAARGELEQSAASLFDAVRSGKVRIDIGQRFPLADAAEAHRALEARQTSGSTILTVGA
jgi:NADPH:quinone reductase